MVREVPVSGHLAGTGAQELRNLQLWQCPPNGRDAQAPVVPVPQNADGLFWYNTNTDQSFGKRIYFHDASMGDGPNGDVRVPRLDRPEAVVAQWFFSPASVQPPFGIGANAQWQKVEGLNADQLDGLDAIVAPTVSTIAARDSRGAVKCQNPIDPVDAVNLQSLDARLGSVTVDASNITGILGLNHGGTAADLTNAQQGGLIYKGPSALAATLPLTGVLIGNGSGAPTAQLPLSVAYGGTGGTTTASSRTSLDVFWTDDTRGLVNARRPRGGLKMDGSANFISGPSNNPGTTLGLGDFTVSFTLKLDTYKPPIAYLWFSHVSGNNMLYIQLGAAGQFQIVFRDGAGAETAYTFVPDVPLVDGKVYVITFSVVRSGNATMYVNGGSDRDRNGTPVSVNVSGSAAINIGSGNTIPMYCTYQTAGVIYAFQVWKSALSAAAVMDLVETNVLPAAAVIDLDFEEADPSKTTVVRDRALNGIYNCSNSTFAVQVQPSVQINTQSLLLSTITANAVLYGGTGGLVTGLAPNSGTIQYLTQSSSGAPAWFDLYSAGITWHAQHFFDVPPACSAGPSVGTHLVNKNYVDGVAAAGIRPLTECRLATTANITLSGEQTIDGVAAVTGNRVLVKDQTTQSQNGTYVIASGAWTRTTDGDTAGELTRGAYTFVTSGAVNAGTSWYQTGTVTTLGTDPVTWTKFFQQAGYQAGVGISITGLTIAVDQAANLNWTGAHTFANVNGVALAPYGSAAGNTTALLFRGLPLSGTVAVGFKAPDSISANCVWTLPAADGAANTVLKTNGSKVLSWGQINSSEITNTSFITNVTGQPGRITVTGSLSVLIDIASTYVGQASITTLGTITTGTWNAAVIGVAYGGTGKASWNTGDLVYASGATTLAGLGITTANKFLISSGSVPTWSAYTMPATLSAGQLLLGNSSGTGVVNLANTAGSILTTDLTTGSIAWTKTLPPGLTVMGDTNNPPTRILKARWFPVGDGSSTTITLPHNFGTNDVIVHVYENISPDFREYPLVPTTRPTNNTVALEFVTAPSLGQFKAVVEAAL